MFIMLGIYVMRILPKGVNPGLKTNSCVFKSLIMHPVDHDKIEGAPEVFCGGLLLYPIR